MAKTKSQPLANNNNKRRKTGPKPKSKPNNNTPQAHDPLPSVSGDPSAPADAVHRLLEPYTKDQLVAFLLDAVADDADLVARIVAAADASVAHRKLFVFGLGWDASRETLIEAFEPYGPIEDCNVIVDKATGRAKGYGFVIFRHRVGALKALKQPEKMIKNRMTQCQLASIGPAAAVSGGGGGDASGRKVYVSNVHPDAAPDRLKSFFAQFGEVEAGPFGYDMLTGKSRGYAIIVYKTLEGARKALEEPHKMFEGRQLHCQLAAESNQKGKTAAALPAGNAGGGAGAASAATLGLMGSAQQPVLAAVAAAQNLALYSQNPAYAAMLSQNPLLAAAAFNPAAFNPAAVAAYNPAAAAMALNPALSSQGQLLSANAGILGGMQSLLGAYGSQGLAALQGLQTYQDSQFGTTPSANPGSSYGGFLQ